MDTIVGTEINPPTPVRVARIGGRDLDPVTVVVLVLLFVDNLKSSGFRRGIVAQRHRVAARVQVTQKHGQLAASKIDFCPKRTWHHLQLGAAWQLCFRIDGVPVSFFVWIRQKTVQTLIDIQRNQLREKRDANREVLMALPSHGQTSSLSIASLLVDDMTSPSQAAVRVEEIQELQSALESMNETDREVLAMRHFEHLNNQQVAEVLGLSPTAASNRYIRAAAKLGEILKSLSSRHGSP